MIHFLYIHKNHQIWKKVTNFLIYFIRLSLYTRYLRQSSFAANDLSDKKSNLSTKHIIIITYIKMENSTLLSVIATPFLTGKNVNKYINKSLVFTMHIKRKFIQLITSYKTTHNYPLSHTYLNCLSIWRRSVVQLQEKIYILVWFSIWHCHWICIWPSYSKIEELIVLFF